MAQVLVRDIELATVNRLKERAKSQGRSLEAELRLILEQAAGEQQGNAAMDSQEVAARVRALFTGQTFSDSTELLREDRAR